MDTLPPATKRRGLPIWRAAIVASACLPILVGFAVVADLDHGALAGSMKSRSYPSMNGAATAREPDACVVRYGRAEPALNLVPVCAL
jgi:hypothetical protein